MRKFLLLCLFALALLALGNQTAMSHQIYGGESEAEWVTYTQPDCYQTQFQAKLWGNTASWEMETSTGYTVVLNPTTEYWCYAELDPYGYYTFSSYRVGIDSPPTTIPMHLRRSSAAQDSIAAELGAFETQVEAARENYRNDPGTPVAPRVYRIAILFWEFFGAPHYPSLNHPHYDEENVELMFTSEDVFYGQRRWPNHEHPWKQTPWGEEPFGSVRDYFLQVSGGRVSIEAGGPFYNSMLDEDHYLIINPIDEDGQIQWLTLPVGVTRANFGAWGGYNRLIDTCASDQLLWINEDNFDIPVFVLARTGAGFKKMVYPATPWLGDKFGAMDSEWQAWNGHIGFVDQTIKIMNIGR